MKKPNLLFLYTDEQAIDTLAAYGNTLILSKWEAIFQDIPVESVIKEHQQEYYDVLSQSNRENHAGSFVEFMLRHCTI